jgi:hypothetical protein
MGSPSVRSSVVVLVLGLGASVAALDGMRPWQPGRGQVGALFAESDTEAHVRDGLLIGRGHEHTQLLPDGGVRVTQLRSYTHTLAPDSGKRVALPEPWRLQSNMLLSPALRLLRAETTLEAHRSIARVLGEDSEDELEPFFEWDRLLITAVHEGTQLTRTTWRKGQVVTHATHDYPSDAIPIETVGIVLSVAVATRTQAFEYELLMADGATHSVRARVHRTRDLRPFARDYAIDLRVLRGAGEFAVIDMCLASPFKRLFFPHHFYFVYSSAQPTHLLALWGGDPDDHLQAVRDP